MQENIKISKNSEKNSGVGLRIDKYISNTNAKLTRTYVNILINNNNILVNAKGVKPSYKLNDGDIITIDLPEKKELEIIPEDIKLDIVYEDNDILIVNKPKGMVVHPAHGNYNGTLVNAILAHCKDSLSGINGVIRPGIVHRIDKDTSGILVIAKNDNSHKNLAEQFKVHSINRIYIALVRGSIKENEGTVDMPISRSKVDRKKMSTNSDGKNAITHFKVLKRYIGYTLLELKLETGRTHQIRVHMSKIGYPIIGDRVYSNGKNDFGVEGQMLHAKTLGIIHPTTNKYMEFDSQLPQYFQEILNGLEEEK